MRREILPTAALLITVTLFGVESCSSTPQGEVEITNHTIKPIAVSRYAHVSTPKTRIRTLAPGEMATAICINNDNSGTPETVRVLTGIQPQIGYVAVFNGNLLQISPGTDALQAGLLECKSLDGTQSSAVEQ